MTIILVVTILLILGVIITIAVCSSGDACKQKQDDNGGN